MSERIKDLLSTAVLIRYLETRFSFLGSEWVKVIKKSRRWLKDVTEHHDIKIGDEDMNRWVENFLKS
jgi:hypothetical protein